MPAVIDNVREGETLQHLVFRGVGEPDWEEAAEAMTEDAIKIVFKR